ncbi:hypothetical protein S40285_02561 [Stachybotrys chlorohalonatus IBT 40285]|uniref:C2H2-type domain-containing protein n=1 Tax=Stachybotrys chlorohalonatus (strain IBT 40285) TaxID=1283841 RepID=A0A084QVT9_STAC4|nr:hypothetical protein S40285_02561 [Stachybotrys chlorohalonata IBT 40285]
MTSNGPSRLEAGLSFLPFRTRSKSRCEAPPSPVSATAAAEKRPSQIVAQEAARPKHLIESLYYSHRKYHLRSPTASSVSSVQSSSLDSFTTRSLASPISTTYASDCLDSLSEHSDEEYSPPPSRFGHRSRPSSESCSTYVNDEEDSVSRLGCSTYGSKIETPHFRLPDFTADRSKVYTPSIRDVILEEDPKPETINNEAAESETPQMHHQAALDRLESTSVSSDDCPTEDTDTILDFALQLAYGLELSEAPISVKDSRTLVQRFVRDLGQLIWQTPMDHQGSSMGPSSMSTPSQGGNPDEPQRGGGKRKKQGKPDDGGDDLSDKEGAGDMPTKRPKPNPKDEENLRLSCPYRKRNPHRFNVRDHHSCAMTYFPKFAELRQHIVKQHKRDDPSAFMCDRCNCDFVTRKDLRDHQRLPKEQMCDIADHNPESGIDGPTANKLLSRKRANGTSSDVQWREIWNIIFPDDDDSKIQTYNFTPVIEHFELSSNYLVAFQELETSLRKMMSNPTTLDTLSKQFQQCFIETVQRCITQAQTMPYTNRSNKKNEPCRVTNYSFQTGSRKVLPRPDSGVVMDDGSDESGSTMDTKDAGRRASQTIMHSVNPSPRSTQEIVAAQPYADTINATFMHHLSSEALINLDTAPFASVNPAVQAWNDALPPPSHGLQGYFMPTPASHADLMPTWDDSFYQPSQAGAQGMEGDFTGFDGRHC